VSNDICFPVTIRQAEESATPAVVTETGTPTTLLKIVWNEGYPEMEGQTFASWEDLQKALVEIANENQMSFDTYYKVMLCVHWENGKWVRERVDIGLDEGDFDPREQYVGDFMRQGKAFRHSSNLNQGDRQFLSWTGPVKGYVEPVVSGSFEVVESDPNQLVADTLAGIDPQDILSAAEQAIAESSVDSDVTVGGFVVEEEPEPPPTPKTNLKRWKDAGGIPGEYFVEPWGYPGEILYFYPYEVLKNGNVRGFRVVQDGGRVKKAVKKSVQSTDLYKVASIAVADLPKKVKRRFDEVADTIDTTPRPKATRKPATRPERKETPVPPKPEPTPAPVSELPASVEAVFAQRLAEQLKQSGLMDQIGDRLAQQYK